MRGSKFVVVMGFFIALMDASAQERSDPVAIDAGGPQPCVLRSDGSVICWDVFLTTKEIGELPKPISGLQPLASFDSGDILSCGLTKEGRITCWANAFEDSGETYEPIEVITPDYPDLPPLISLSVGFGHVCGIDAAGGVWCTGENALGERGFPPDKNPGAPPANRVERLPPAVDVSAGVNNTCAVTKQGEAYCWGSDNQGRGRPFAYESIDPFLIQGVSGLAAIENGRNFACALKPPDMIICWGSNIMGQLAAPASEVPLRGRMSRLFTRNVRDFSVSYFSACVAPEQAGVWCWGNWNHKILFTPTAKAGLPSARDVSVSGDRGCIISTDNEVWCWGQKNHNGADGPSSTYRVEPVRIELPVLARN